LGELVESIAVVTDTTSDIPEELSSRHKIEIIPLYIGYEGNLYLEGKEMTNELVFEKLRSGIKVKTSGPSIGDFEKIYKKLIEIDKKTLIYSIHLSSKLSSTFNTACQAAKLFPQTKIKVIDSNTAAISLGFIALEVARAAQRNENREKIDCLIDFMINHNKLLATFENFQYLFMGGRAPVLKKFLSKSIILKPIVVLDNGIVKLKKFARSKKNSIIELYKQIKKYSLPQYKKKIGIFYGSDIKPALELEEMVNNDSEIEIDELILTEITTIISGHTGPGIWGITSNPVPNEW
jgi:DegV family protein with EDD domain